MNSKWQEIKGIKNHGITRNEVVENGAMHFVGTSLSPTVIVPLVILGSLYDMLWQSLMPLVTSLQSIIVTVSFTLMHTISIRTDVLTESLPLIVLSYLRTC